MFSPGAWVCVSLGATRVRAGVGFLEEERRKGRGERREGRGKRRGEREEKGERKEERGEKKDHD